MNFIRLPATTLCLALAAPMLAVPSAAQAQAAAPARAAPAAATGTPPAAPAFANIPQLCQAREREIVGINGQLLGRVRAAEAEKDTARRAQILAPMGDLRSNLVQSEASWQRLDCARILYGAR